MPQIGEFIHDESGFIGHLTTLLLSQDVIIIEAELSDAENAPSYRVHVFDGMNNETGPEIGAGWKRTGEKAGEYIAVLLDDPASHSRSAPTCSATTMPERPGRCTGTVRQSATGRTEPMRGTVLLLLSGLSFAASAPVVVHAQTAPIDRSAQRNAYADHVAEAAQRFGIPATWIRAVLRVESNGDPRAISPKGAMGLMQLMPGTWSGLRIRLRLGSDPYDPHDNVIAGTAYIRELFDRYGSPGWIAAYNAGPGRYEASLKGRPLPSETRAYVATIAPNLDGDDKPAAAMIASADPLTWTRAPLFIAQPAGHPTAASVQAERAPIDATSTPTVRDVSAIVPQSGGLFVARATGMVTP